MARGGAKEPERLVSILEAARSFGVSVRTVERLMLKNKRL